MAAWGSDEKAAVIYEGKVLQCAVAIQAAPGEAKMLLYLAVKGPSPLTNLTVQCPPDDVVRVMCAPNQLPAVNPGPSTRLSLRWHCRKPFPVSPPIVLNFSYNGQPQSLSLHTPVHTCHFVSGVRCTREQFIGKWGSLAANQTQHLMNLTTALTVAQLAARIASALKLEVLTGIEPDPNNINCCGMFNSIGTQPNNTPIRMTVIVRIETKPGVPMLKVTLRTDHRSVNAAVLKSMELCLRGTSRNLPAPQ